MQILVLLGLIMALMSVSTGILQALPSATVLTPLMAIVYFVGVVAWGRLSVVTLRRAMVRSSGPAANRRYHRTVLAEKSWLLTGAAALLIGGYASWICDDLGLRSVPLLASWAAAVPFALALIISWIVGYPAHRATRLQVSDAKPLGEPPLAVWSRRQYVLFQTRTHLLLIAVPLSLIVLIQDVLVLYVGPALDDRAAAYVIPAAMLLAVVGVLIGAPFLIRRVWSTQPLPAGQMREELTALCDRLGLRRRDILLWHSHGVLANAAVMGLIRQIRYLLLSDALLERMERRQVLAVCAHEAGHVVGYHMLTIGLFALTTAGLAGAAGETLFAVSAAPVWAIEVFIFSLLAPLWVFGFGWLSRRLERQCDVAAAWVMGKLSADETGADADWTDPTVTPRGAAILASALERVADLNGMPVSQRNWRHGSIAWRVHYILSLAAGGGSRADIDRAVRRWKRALWLAFVAAVGANVAVMFLLENSP